MFTFPPLVKQRVHMGHASPAGAGTPANCSCALVGLSSSSLRAGIGLSAAAQIGVGRSVTSSSVLLLLPHRLEFTLQAFENETTINDGAFVEVQQFSRWCENVAANSVRIS